MSQSSVISLTCTKGDNKSEMEPRTKEAKRPLHAPACYGVKFGSLENCLVKILGKTVIGLDRKGKTCMDFDGIIFAHLKLRPRVGVKCFKHKN